MLFPRTFKASCRSKSERGATLVEYSVLLSCLTLIAVAACTQFGESLKGSLQQVAFNTQDCVTAPGNLLGGGTTGLILPVGAVMCPNENASQNSSDNTVSSRGSDPSSKQNQNGGSQIALNADSGIFAGGGTENLNESSHSLHPESPLF